MYFLDDSVSHFDFSFPKLHNRLHRFDVDRSVAPAINFIVNLEDPRVHKKIVSDKAGQRIHEFIAVVDIVRRNGGWDVCLLEDAFCPGFCRIEIHLFRFTTDDRDCQRDRKLNVCLCYVLTRNYVSLPASSSFDDRLDSLQSLWRVEKGLCQTVVLGELHIVFGNDDVESLVSGIDFYEFEYLKVVLVYVVGERERTYVDNVDIWVLDGENTCNLRVLLLLELLCGESLQLGKRVRVDMYFNTFLGLDLGPPEFEFLLHLPPHLNRLLLQLAYSLLCGLLQLVKTVTPLDYSGLLH